MANTPNLSLPYLDAAQAQKHVTHNAALTILDALTHIQAQSNTLTTPPTSPADGQCWIVAVGATGAWAGKDNSVAAWQDGLWNFYPPLKGYIAFVDTLGGTLMWNGSSWVSIISSITTLGNLLALGIATAADLSNPLSCVLNNALFSALGTGSGGTGDLRFKLNKSSFSNTVSQLYQEGFSGRAETGLTGDDNFHIKVSADGSSWHEGINVAASTGIVSFPSGLAAAGVANGLATLDGSGKLQAAQLPAMAAPQGYLGGLVLANDGASPNTVIDIAAGACTADDAVTFMKLASAFAKSTGSWTVGGGTGGLDTGSVAALTWYHVYIIQRPDTGNVDVLLSTSATSPTMPTNYTKKRRIGSFKTDGSSHILAFKQVGEKFLWVTPVLDINSATIGTSYTALNLVSVPLGVAVEPIIAVYATRASAAPFLYVSNPDTGPASVNTGTLITWTHVSAGNGLTANPSVVGSNLYTGVSQNIRVAADAASTSLSIETLGWTDTRGRFA